MSHKSTTICRFIVKLAVPTGSNARDLQLYIRNSINSYKGGLSPDDPLFELNTELMTVALLEKTTTYIKG